MTETSKPIATLEEPPPPTKRQQIVINWDEVVDFAKREHPGQWVRVHHTYATANSARSSVQRAAKLYDLEYRVTTRSPQDDGRPGAFVKYIPKGE